MAKQVFLIPDEIADLFDDYGDQVLIRKAVLELVDRHREEYEEIVGSTLEAEVQRLERHVAEQRRRITTLEKLNPKMVNVPMLTETANRLQKAVEEREDKRRAKRRKK